MDQKLVYISLKTTSKLWHIYPNSLIKFPPKHPRIVAIYAILIFALPFGYDLVIMKNLKIKKMLIIKFGAHVQMHA